MKSILIIEKSENPKNLLVKVGNFGPLFFINFIASLVIFVIGGTILYYIEVTQFSQIPGSSGKFILGIILFIVLFLAVLKSWDIRWRLKRVSVNLQREGNIITLIRNYSPNGHVDTKIEVMQDTKLLLSRHVNSLFFYQLMIQQGEKLELLVPAEYNPLEAFPKFGSVNVALVDNFVYTPDNAKVIAEFLGIPLERTKRVFMFFMYEKRG